MDTIARYWLEKSNIAQEMSCQTSKIRELYKAVEDTFLFNGTVFTMANGGGASAAEGFAVDLATHPFVPDNKTENPGPRHKLQVECLCTSVGLITGISNDLGFDHIFVEQLMNHDLGPNDLLIGFSGSGNSPNIIKAFEHAKRFDARTACVSGRGGGKAAKLVDISIVIPGTSTFPGQTGPNDNNFHIEDFQVSISHIVTGLLKEYYSENFN